jgi:tetratricopeptide (TPR) repeat protein
MMSPGSSSQTGTQLYMAPELMAGKPASTRSDIYSLGVVLYQLLIGDFSRPLTTDWAKRIDDPSLREDLEKCFAGDPEERFASAHELSTNLHLLERRRRELVARQTAAHRRRVASIAAIVAIVLAGLISVAILATKQAKPFGNQTGKNTSEPVGTTNVQANDRYTRGKSLFFVNSTKDELKNAVTWFEESVNLDPNFAQAYADLASACRLLDVLWEPDSGWDKRALEAAEKALSLDPRLAAAYVVRGALFFTPAQGWKAADDVEYQRKAISLNSKVKNAHFNLAFVYYHLGFLEEAIDDLDKEQDLDPLNLTPQWLKAFNLLALGHYPEALQIYTNLTDGVFPHARHRGAGIGLCLFYLGRTNDASAFLEAFLKKLPETDDAYLLSILAMVDASHGDREKAQGRIEKAAKGENRFIDSHHVSYYIGCAYALMRENKLAVKWLKNSAEYGNPCYPCYKNDRTLGNLHGDAEFEAFLRDLKKEYERNRAKLKLLMR